MEADPRTRPLFSERAHATAARASALGFRPEWLARLRLLLLQGRAPSDLSDGTGRAFRDWAAAAPLLETTLAEVKTTATDGASKLLIRLRDGNAVETVVLPTGRGVSVCLSSQVGCAVGCRFCASGQAGLVRNLDGHEIAEQIVHARRVRPDVDRLVVMGIGEPMMNAANLFHALDVLREEGGIGPRRVIVSTVGTHNAIRRLGEYGYKVTLALSLHAPDDALRAELIPSMKHVRIADLLDDCDWYIRTTGRKGLAEYTLLAGVNDSDEHARRVGELLRDRQMYLNVIPYNPVAGAGFGPVSAERARHFVDVVREHGSFATVRKTMGAAEYAACGQLRAQFAAP